MDLDFTLHELLEFFDEKNESDTARADLARATNVKYALLQRTTPSELFTYNSDTMNELHDSKSPLVFPFKPIVDIMRSCNPTSKISIGAQMYFARAASSIADEIMDTILCTSANIGEAEVNKTLNYMNLHITNCNHACRLSRLSLCRLLDKHRMKHQFTITPQARLTLLSSIVKNLQVIATEIQGLRAYNKCGVTTKIQDVQHVTDWWIGVRPYSRTTYESRTLQARNRVRLSDGRFETLL